MERKKLRRDSLEESIKYLNDGTIVFDKESILKKQLGINLVLVSLADDSANRLHRISQALRIAEDKIFNKEYIQNLEPEDVLSLWKLAQTSGDKERAFLSEVRKYLDWSDLGDQLDLSTVGNGTRKLDAKEPDEKEVKATKELRENTAEILSLMSRLNSKKQTGT